MAPTIVDPGLDPFALPNLVEPHPLYERLRALGPVTLLESRNLWLVSSYDAVREVLRSPERFLSGRGTAYVRAEVSGIRGPLVDTDPPEHSRLRRLVRPWFTPGAIERRRLLVRDLVRRFVDDALDAGPVDVMPAVARPLPVAVVGALLGIDHPDGAFVSAALDSAMYLFGPDPAPEHVGRFLELVGWLANTGLPTLHQDSVGRSVMDGEGDLWDKVGLVSSIWVAGVDTSTNLIGSLLHALAQHPDQWRVLVDDPGLVPAAIEEAVRYESPIRSLMRRTTAPTELFGAKVPADADVCVMYGAANRDPNHYPAPDRFDVRRNPDDHVAFGSGIHLCLGAPLLRVEAGELLQYLVQRVRAIDLAGEPVRNPNPVIRGFLSLPVTFSA